MKLTPERIHELFESLGGMHQWLKSFGYQQFAFLVEEEVNKSEPIQYWRCRQCHSLERLATPCWKCGSECIAVPSDWPQHEVPDVQLIRRLAREKGYCIAEHGSKERDIDLVAIPWTDDAVDHNELVEHLLQGLRNNNGEDGRARLFPIEPMPGNRWACNIQVNGWYKLIDLSITPRRQDVVKI